MTTVELTGETFEKTVTGDDIVLVDFWASWCQPCLRFAPVFEKAAGETDGVTFAKVDTQTHQGLAEELSIDSIPTIMAFREGVLLFRQAGALSGGQLQQLITQVKDIDMEKVHAEVKKLESEHAEGHDHDHAEGHDHDHDGGQPTG